MLHPVTLGCAAWLFCSLATASPLDHGRCDENCVCDGLDLSGLSGPHDICEVTGQGPGLPHVDDKTHYRLSICAPLTASDLVGTSCTETDTMVVRYSLPNSTSRKCENVGPNTAGVSCEGVGQAVAAAQRSVVDGVMTTMLVYVSDEGGIASTVKLTLQCAEGDGTSKPDAATITRLCGKEPCKRGYKPSDVTSQTIETKWVTSGACPKPDRPKTCDDKCVCDGLDLSMLKGGHRQAALGMAPDGQAKLKPDGWVYSIEVCEDIPSARMAELPGHCPVVAARVVQHNGTAMDAQPDHPREGCHVVGSEVTNAELTVTPPPPGQQFGSLGVDITFEYSAPSPTPPDGPSSTGVLDMMQEDSIFDTTVDSQVVGHITCAQGDMGEVKYVVDKGLDSATGKQRYEFNWSTAAVCDEKRPHGRTPDASNVCTGACSCAGVDLSGLKTQVYTVQGIGAGGRQTTDNTNWTYVFAVCGAIPAADRGGAAAAAACEGVPGIEAASALRYNTHRQPPACEVVGNGTADAFKTTNIHGGRPQRGVELIYTSLGGGGGGSTDCAAGRALQLHLTCDATAQLTATPAGVIDLTDALSPGSGIPGVNFNPPDSCLFDARVVTACVKDEHSGDGNSTLIIALIAAGCAVVAVGAAVMVVRKKKREGMSRYSDVTEGLLNEESFGAN
jgi:hypothetical protein